MPLYHCGGCHHEYEGVEPRTCGWCGSKDYYLLEEKTPLDKMFDYIHKVGMSKFLDKLGGKK